MTKSPDGNENNVGLFASPADATKKISSEYEYWSGKLTETSLQMCYAIIGANWIVFGSVNGILGNIWAKLSLLMVILALATNIVGALMLSEGLKERAEYAETDPARWIDEFEKLSRTRCPWPFTAKIEATGRWMRIIKATFTLTAGAFLIFGAVVKWWIRMIFRGAMQLPRLIHHTSVSQCWIAWAQSSRRRAMSVTAG